METLQTLFEQLFSGDEEQAEAAAPAFAAHGLAAVKALREHWQRENEDASSAVDRRWWILRALAEIDDPQAVEILIEALQSPDPSLRQCAALGLARQRSPRAVPALSAALDDPDTLCADLAREALIAAGGPAVPELLEVLENGSRPARIRAVRALAYIGDRRAIPALFRALEADSTLMEYWASEGLDRMGVGMSFFKP